MAANFASYNLDERVVEAVEKLRFKRPTPVQAKVIPSFYQKLNLIVEAPTGTGKTAAYGLPLISLIDVHKRSTQALVLAPSRELALQVASALRSYYNGDKLEVGTIHGGVPLSESESVIRSGAQIMVAVPGRLKDLMAHSKMNYFWRNIKYFIMDEGDKLMEMGFQKDFDAIRSKVRNRAQMGFFSATISPDAEAMMKERLVDAHVIRLSPREVLKNIQFRYIKVQSGQRDRYLGGLLKHENLGQALIFCSRREEVQMVTNYLRNVGYKAQSYYGSMEQHERENILNRFKTKNLEYLVASDLAARGLDIEDLPCVVNLSVPQQFDYYLHRVGRTGRAGNRGKVVNFLTSEAAYVYLENHHDKIGLALEELMVEPMAKSSMRIAEREKWGRYQLSRGKRDKIRKGDVVGFLTNQAQLGPDDIGTITLYDSYTIVDMPSKGYEVLQENLDILKLKGKSVKVKRFTAKEQERKARSVKNMQKGSRDNK